MAIEVLSDLLFDLFLDRTCAGCGQRVGRHCDRCAAHLVVARPVTFGDGIRAGVHYDGVARRLILGLKYRGQLATVGMLVDVLEQVVRSDASFVPDVVTWAPTSAVRRRVRGADQAQLLARALGRRLGVPCPSLLRRVSGPAQTGRDRSTRLIGPSFVSRPLPNGVRVLVVDDVVTTGATLRAAMGALRSGGAGTVRAIAVAATPDRGQPESRPRDEGRPAMGATHR